MNSRSTVIFSGTSVTNDQAWPTWATWIKRHYGFKNVIDQSARGIGNEVILNRAVDAAFKASGDVYLLVQLTSVDKWDWYIQDAELMKKIQLEKHPGILVDKNDQYGYWCTGSHFPLWKEHYKDNYFSIDHQTFKTLQLIQWFTMLCEKHNWKHQIIFESPLLSVTEQQLNTGQLTKDECVQTTLTENSLCRILNNSLDLEQFYLPGIIGYACINNLPWFHPTFKSHPGSLVHYYYARDIVCPALDQVFDAKSSFELLKPEAERFQNLFDSKI